MRLLPFLLLQNGLHQLFDSGLLCLLVVVTLVCSCLALDPGNVVICLLVIGLLWLICAYFIYIYICNY